jgi:hypothetical protein
VRVRLAGGGAGQVRRIDGVGLRERVEERVPRQPQHRVEEDDGRPVAGHEDLGADVAVPHLDVAGLDVVNR